MYEKLAISNDICIRTVLGPSHSVSVVLKDTFVCGLPGLLGIAVHSQWPILFSYDAFRSAASCL